MPAGTPCWCWPNGDTDARLATGLGIGVATVYRHIREALDLLAGSAAGLRGSQMSSPKTPREALRVTMSDAG
jgi:hypothetical protein